MKRTINVLAIVATFVVFAAPALAQTAQCTEEFKTATYKKYYDNRKDKQEIAFQAAEEWIATCPTEESAYATAIKKFHAAYKAATGTDALKKQLDDAYKKEAYADQIRLGKQLIAVEPENTAVYIIMGNAGLGDANLLVESSQYAKKAIEMVEAGKPFAPLSSKDQALAYLNYNIGKSLLKSAPADAIPHLVKAAQLESQLKKSAQLYLDLANAYGEGPIARQSEEYKAKYTTETPESKAAAEYINQLIDHQIDALARAAALTTNAANKKAIMDLLTGLYTDRNKSTTGLDTLLTGVLSKPILEVPTPPTPPTPAVTPTPAATPTPGATATPTATPAPAATPTSATSPAATPTTPAATPTAKPAASRAATPKPPAAKPTPTPTPTPTP